VLDSCSFHPLLFPLSTQAHSEVLGFRLTCMIYTTIGMHMVQI